MKFSYNWLKEMTKTKKSPNELANMVMLRGFELEGIERIKAAGQADVVLEFDVLPNRAHDCLSYEGMAREICAMSNLKLSLPVSRKPRSGSQRAGKGKIIEINTKDKKLCPRYIGAFLADVKIGPSPRWMQSRLIASGMEPINNVVDITNYVMLETGNPLHAFDASKLEAESGKGKDLKLSIFIRKAKDGERLELLDGTVLNLGRNDLVIADKENLLALAGIKGGKTAEISSRTTEIILESANFDAYNIRKSRQRHNIFSESQQRFEKGISPVLAEKAAVRAVELLQKYAGAKLAEINDADYFRQKARSVNLDVGYAGRLLGCEIKAEQVIKILGNLGFVLKSGSGGKLVFEVPYWRLDIEGPEDLIEEIGRIEGYEKIKEESAEFPAVIPEKNKRRDFEWILKDLLCGLGFDEVFNYSFVSEEDAKLVSDGECFQLENPLSSDQVYLRRSLLSNILKNTAQNAKYFEDFSVFELGRIYLPEKFDGNPEDLRISGAVFSSRLKGGELFYLAKGKLEGLLEALVGLYDEDEIKFAPVGGDLPAVIYHRARTAEIFFNDRPIGYLGQVDQNVCEKYCIKKDVVVFEMDFEKIRQVFEGRKIGYKPAGKYPLIRRDISMFVRHKTQAAQVTEAIKKSGGKFLRRVELFDVYEDKKTGQKSMAFHLWFGAADKTLRSQEADKAVKAIIKSLEDKLKAKVRMK